jgi:hypothetical protein
MKMKNVSKTKGENKNGILTPEEVEHLKHWKKTSIKSRLDFLESVLVLNKKVS